MSKRSIFLLAALAPLVFAAAGSAQPSNAPAAADWPTWGYDQQRSAWNRGETTLSKDNVSRLRLLWSAQVSTPPTEVALSTLTAPLVVEGVSTPQGAKNMLFVLGADDTLFALDAESGKPLWQKTFPNPIKAGKPATWLCPNTPNDTPVIDKAKGVIYFIASDGKLRGLALSDGAERLTPTDMVAPFTRAWSLNLIGDVVYTTSGRACGEVVDKNSAMAAAALSLRRQPGRRGPAASTTVLTDPSAVTAMDIRDPMHPLVTRFYTSGARPAAPWGRGGLIAGPDDSVILETSDGLDDPALGDFSESILKLSGKAARLVDSFAPENHKYILSKDLAGSANPTIFPFGGKMLVAASQKEGVLRLLDADNLGGPTHSVPLYQSPQLGNDAATGTDPGRGVWGGITTYLTPGGRRMLYLPMLGPPSKFAPAFKYSYGDTPNGSIMAFEVVGDGDKPTVTAQWNSPDLIMPDPPVVANGVVYAIQSAGQAMQNMAHPGEPRMDTNTSMHLRSKPVSNLVLYAFDAETGKTLYSSKKIVADWVHFSEPVVALGKVFVVTHDAHVYAFGLKR